MILKSRLVFLRLYFLQSTALSIHSARNAVGYIADVGGSV